MPVEGGGFHIKAATMPGAPAYFAAKTNANFPGNPKAHDLPTVQGAILLFDATNGCPLAIMDSAEETALRTGATTGDLHHAIDCGAFACDEVHAELGDIVARRKPGRQSEAEAILFDSSGVALGDVAAAALVCERAIELGGGASIRLTD